MEPEKKVSTFEFPKPLPPNKQQELLKQIRGNDDKQAWEKLIIHNLKLVYYVARKYRAEKNDIDDLFQTGVIGLIKAIEKYNPDKGAKFSTYAVYWIKQSIVRQMMNIGKDLSLDKETNEGEGTTLQDIIEDPTLEPLEETAERKELVAHIRAMVDENLTSEEKRVIHMKYGFYNGIERTDREIGESIGKGRDYITKKRESAQRKLRKTSYIRRLARERYVDSRTPFYKAVDYSQPQAKTNYRESIVEYLAQYREKIRNAAKVKDNNGY